MTRKFLDTVRSELTAQLATSNLTTAPQLDVVLQDLIDSTIQDESAIIGETPVLGFVTAAGFTEIDNAFTVDVGGDGSFLIPNALSGQIQTSAIAGYSYSIKAQISIADMTNNTPVEFSLMSNGVETGFVATLNGQGNGRPMTASFSGLKLSGLANEVWSIGVSTPNGANTIDILNASLSVTILPTNNP